MREFIKNKLNKNELIKNFNAAETMFDRAIKRHHQTTWNRGIRNHQIPLGTNILTVCNIRSKHHYLFSSDENNIDELKRHNKLLKTLIKDVVDITKNLMQCNGTLNHVNLTSSTCNACGNTSMGFRNPVRSIEQKPIDQDIILPNKPIIYWQYVNQLIPRPNRPSMVISVLTPFFSG
jgi:hypothetical protein